MLAVTLAIAIFALEEPQPLRLVEVKDEPWGEIIYYSEGGRGGLAMRNLLIDFRRLGGTGQFEVEVREVGRKIEGNKSPEFLAQFTKYLDALPKVRVTDMRGRSAPKGMNTNVYPSGFWGFFLPDRLEPGQTTWTVELQPPFHTRWATMPLSYVSFKFDPSPVLGPGQKPHHYYSYSCDAVFDAPLSDSEIQTIYRLWGGCWVDPKTQQIFQVGSTASWSAKFKDRSFPEGKYSLVTITHELRRGRKWDLS